jgi:hypothetical protein
MEVTEPDDEAIAKRLCHTCPVLQECGTWVVSLPPRTDPDGIVAGMTLAERANLRRKITRRARAKTAEPPRTCTGPCGETRPAEEFYLRARGKGKRDSRCSTCCVEDVRARRAAAKAKEAVAS